MSLVLILGDLAVNRASTLEKEADQDLSLTESSKGTDILVDKALEDIIIDDHLVEILTNDVEIQEMDIEETADQRREEDMMGTEEEIILTT